jgi:hypothetical protein
MAITHLIRFNTLRGNIFGDIMAIVVSLSMALISEPIRLMTVIPVYRFSYNTDAVRVKRRTLTLFNS